MRTVRLALLLAGGLAALAFLAAYVPFRPWLSADFGPDDSDDPGEDSDA